jgi:protein-tyrosine phosphatase
LIDLHSHVLPGVDDGARALDESLDILRGADEDGITRIAATPHVHPNYPTSPEAMEAGVAAVAEAARAAGIAVEVLPGGELDCVAAQSLDDATLRRFGLGGNPELLLVETPLHGWPLDLADMLFRLRSRGFRLVLAHPERNAEVQAEPEKLRPIVESGVAVQLTAASVDGRLGRVQAASSRTLLDTGLAHLIASDAHAPAIRAIGMTAAAEAVGDAELAHWLTHDVPEALLAGAALPDRPQKSRFRLRRH